MNEVIYKFQLYIGRKVDVTMPVGSRILDFQYQDEIMCMWAIIPTGAAKQEVRTFRIVATGEPCDFKDHEYKKTLQDYAGVVWHIFEVVG